MVIFIALLRREGPEASARELLKDNLSKAASLISMRRQMLKKQVRDVGWDAVHCSRCIHLLTGRQD